MEIDTNLPLFSDLNEHEMDFLRQHLCEKTFKAGQFVLHQGESGGDLYLLKSGEVSVLVSIPGDEQREATKLHAGQIFGEVAFLTDAPITATIVASQRAVCVILYHKVLQMLRVANPHLAYKIEEKITRQTTDKIISNLSNIITIMKSVPESEQQQAKPISNLINKKAQFTEIPIGTLNHHLILNLSYFKELLPEDAAYLLEQLKVGQYERGYCFSPKKSRKIALVYSGAVMLFVHEDAHLKKPIAVVGLGELFIQNFREAELNKNASYVTCEESVLLELDYEVYQAMQKNHPACFYAVSQYIHNAIASSVYIVNRQFVRFTCEYSDLLKEE